MVAASTALGPRSWPPPPLWVEPAGYLLRTAPAGYAGRRGGQGLPTLPRNGIGGASDRIHRGRQADGAGRPGATGEPGPGSVAGPAWRRVLHWYCGRLRRLGPHAPPGDVHSLSNGLDTAAGEPPPPIGPGATRRRAHPRGPTALSLAGSDAAAGGDVSGAGGHRGLFARAWDRYGCG